MQYVKLEREGQLALLTIDRPRAMNALNREVLEELGQVFTTLVEEGETLVAILTGAGERAFVAGADISAMVDMDFEEAQRFACLGQQVFATIEAAPLVVIAAINGFALGGGCELAMACDVRIATEGARLGQPEVNLGVIPGFGGTQRLARLVGRSRAKRLIFTGELIDAAHAERLGLVDQVVAADQLLSVCRELGKSIASKAPLAIRGAKRAIDRGLDLTLEQGSCFEAQEFAQLFSSQDQEEGMRAFLGKRAPVFEGK